MLQGSRMVLVLIGFGLLSAPAWSQSREENFRAWDADGDGAIDASEHRAVMQDNFGRMDADANGNRSVEEMYDSLVQEQQRTGITTSPEAVRSVAMATIQYVRSHAIERLSRGVKRSQDAYLPGPTAIATAGYMGGNEAAQPGRVALPSRSASFTAVRRINHSRRATCAL